MKKTRTSLIHWKKFFREDLWRFDFYELTRGKKSWYQTLQVFFLVTQGFVKDKVLLRASALTYSTLLAIVPLLAFMFAILKGMGVQRRLEPLLLERMAAGASQEMIAQILSYIDRINVGSLGAIGLVLLILTVIGVLGNIEAAFNEIWGLTQPRPLLRKFSDYFSLIFILPLLFFAALSLTASLKSATVVLWMQAQPGLGPMVVLLLRLTPFFALWGLFIFLFMFMPNTRVKFTSALIAGVFTGTLWQATQWAYVTFQVGVAKYNAIYGTFAQLPIMFIWIYVSWVIVLFGAEFSFALQNVATYRQERESGEVHFQARQELSLAFLRLIQERFVTGSPVVTAEQLAQEQAVPVRLARRVLADLMHIGLLTKVTEEGSVAYLPSRQLETLEAADVLEQLERMGTDLAELPGLNKQASLRESALRSRERDWLARARAGRRKALKGNFIGKS